MSFKNLEGQGYVFMFYFQGEDKSPLFTSIDPNFPDHHTEWIRDEDEDGPFWIPDGDMLEHLGLPQVFVRRVRVPILI